LACLQDRRALDLASVAEAEEEDTILLSIVKHVLNQLLQFLSFLS
jgi:hypothetical protein